MSIVNSAAIFEDHLPKVRKATVVIEYCKPIHIKELDKEIKEYCNSRMAEYKWIRTIEFVSEMPKTISGKIRKSELRKQG